MQHGPLTQLQDSAAFCLPKEELFCELWKPKVKHNQETETVLLFVFLSFPELSKTVNCLLSPGPQLPPLKMPFSDFSTWEQTFQDLIQEEKPGAKWTLQLSKSIVPDDVAQGWRQYQKTVLGR